MKVVFTLHSVITNSVILLLLFFGQHLCGDHGHRPCYLCSYSHVLYLLHLPCGHAHLLCGHACLLFSPLHFSRRSFTSSLRSRISSILSQRRAEADRLTKTASKIVQPVIIGFTNRFDCLVIIYCGFKIWYSIIDREQNDGSNSSGKRR